MRPPTLTYPPPPRCLTAPSCAPSTPPPPTSEHAGIILRMPLRIPCRTASGTLQTLHDDASWQALTTAAAALHPPQPLRSSLPLLPSFSHTLPTLNPQVGDVLAEGRRPPRAPPAGQVPEQGLQAGAPPCLVKPDVASELSCLTPAHTSMRLAPCPAGLGPPCLLQRVSLFPSTRVHSGTCTVFTNAFPLLCSCRACHDLSVQGAIALACDLPSAKL